MSLSAHARGVIFVLTSACLFYLATFFVRLASMVYDVPGSWYLLARFLPGMPLFFFFMHRRGDDVRNRGWLIMRAVFNVVAVVFFIYAAHFGSVMNANVLNMTYPAFVALLSPIFIGEKSTYLTWIAVAAAVAGSALITLGGKTIEIHPADILGLVSGITAGVGVMSLRQIRKTDSTFNVLYYTFLFGTTVSLILVVLETALLPQLPSAVGSPRFWMLLSASGLCGLVGQWVFTYGFAWVGAVEGSILSSTRILIALLFGITCFHESFTFAAGAGALLVLFSNISLALRNRS
jgi:drug/metabolite transporter (DMT)-like permease